jgi:DNA-binding NarL/FixJ family response regulator
MSHPGQTSLVKVAIAEDHTLVREAFKNHINHYPEFRVVLEVEDGSKLLKELKLKIIDIDVLLLDLFSPRMDGRETLKIISKLYPSIRVVILSACTDQKIISDLFGLGVYGFVSKNSEPDELYEAILSAANNKVYQNKFYYLHQNLTLNATEIKVLELIWMEKTNEEIANKMCLSLSTIEKIRHQLKEKTDSKTTVGLIKYALEKRIIIPGQP